MKLKYIRFINFDTTKATYRYFSTDLDNDLLDGAIIESKKIIEELRTGETSSIKYFPVLIEDDSEVIYAFPKQ